MPSFKFQIPDNKYKNLKLWQFEHNCDSRNKWEDIYRETDLEGTYLPVFSYIITVKNKTSRIDVVCECGSPYEDVCA